MLRGPVVVNCFCYSYFYGLCSSVIVVAVAVVVVAIIFVVVIDVLHVDHLLSICCCS